MKSLSLLTLCFTGSLLMASCTKEDNNNDESSAIVVQSATNINDPVKPGEPNCTEPISDRVKLKASVDASQSTTTAAVVKIDAKTEKLYPSGGYILVYDLNRTTSTIRIDYKQVNTACGNPAAAALLPATSTLRITNLAPGSYPVELRVGTTVNKGTLQVASGSATLQMQTTNGIVIE
jgi:hypothetical protein